MASFLTLMNYNQNTARYIPPRFVFGPFSESVCADILFLRSHDSGVRTSDHVLSLIASLYSVSASCCPLCVIFDTMQSPVVVFATIFHLLLKLYVHLIMWNRVKAKCLRAAEWQKPTVTWNKSCTYDKVLATAEGTLKGNPPTHTSSTLIPNPFSFLTLLLL